MKRWLHRNIGNIIYFCALQLLLLLILGLLRYEYLFSSIVFLIIWVVATLHWKPQ